MPGVEVHATQMLNLLRGDWLTRQSRAVERFWMLAVGVLFGAGLLWLRPVPASAAALVGAGVVMAVAVGLFHLSSLWFPWLIIAAVQIPVALGGSVLFHSLDWHRARRRLEAARRADEARIREQAALIEMAHDAILVQSLDGKITYANPGTERLYGWSGSELQNGKARGIEADPSKIAEIRASVLRRGEWSGELQQRNRTGHRLTVENRWTLIRDEQGAPKSLLVINSDVTEKRQLEAESLRLQRTEAIGALASGMAHDLNNALAPVLMGAQLLRREAPNEEALRILCLMESSTQRGADIVRQVLLFARGRQGGRERLDLPPLINEMVKLVRETFPKTIIVNAHIADDLWPVRGNTTEIHQVLLNLCVNARDAMPGGGTLNLALDNVELSEDEACKIAGAKAGQFVSLLVSDSGMGIPPEALPRIFEAFFTTKAEGEGTGLGLSTTLRIVKAHGGFLTVQTQPGEGASFEVYLPRFAGAVADEAPVPVTVPPRGCGELILVAEDDEAVREILRRSLEEHGYRVLTAANGVEAVSEFKRHSAELAMIISDESMPVMDGAKAVAAILATGAKLPAIMLTGGGDFQIQNRGADRAGVEYLSKPVELDVLLHAVSRVLKSL